jgi:hypothetical protein
LTNTDLAHVPQKQIKIPMLTLAPKPRRKIVAKLAKHNRTIYSHNQSCSSRDFPIFDIGKAKLSDEAID